MRAAAAGILVFGMGPLLLTGLIVQMTRRQA